MFDRFTSDGQGGGACAGKGSDVIFLLEFDEPYFQEMHLQNLARMEPEGDSRVHFLFFSIFEK